MTKLFHAALVAAVVMTTVPAPSDAGVMTRACLKSDRSGATRSMCSCIQKTANKNLSRSDQKLAATFIKEPHKAQEIRQSDRRSHEIFWKRYKTFGSAVSESCDHLR